VVVLYLSIIIANAFENNFGKRDEDPLIGARQSIGAKDYPDHVL
jgi:hypothetical protein